MINFCCIINNISYITMYDENALLFSCHYDTYSRVGFADYQGVQEILKDTWASSCLCLWRNRNQ